MNPYSVYIIEDDGIHRENITDYFEKEGFKVIGTCKNSDIALDEIPALEPDLIVTDKRLHGSKLNGFETALKIRKKYFCGIIFLTAHINKAESRTILREHRCIDVINKPFDDNTLMLSLERLMENCPHLNSVKFSNGCRFNLQTKTLYHGEAPVDLTPYETQLVTLMAENIGKFLSYEDIEHRLWPIEPPKSDSSRKNLINGLRRKVGSIFWKYFEGKGLFIL